MSAWNRGYSFFASPVFSSLLRNLLASPTFCLILFWCKHTCCKQNLSSLCKASKRLCIPVSSSNRGLQGQFCARERKAVFVVTATPRWLGTGGSPKACLLAWKTSFGLLEKGWLNSNLQDSKGTKFAFRSHIPVPIIHMNGKVECGPG